LKTNKVLVIGDIILDKYINGSVSRISPEAPIPIIKIKKEKCILGGAANVANNLASLGCDVTIIGSIGRDESGEKINHLLRINNISSNIVHSNHYKTIIKTRVIGNKQQIVRLDYNDDNQPTSNSIKDMIKTFQSIIDSFDVVVLSDYNKGVCNPILCEKIIEVCNKKDIPVIVDPKGTDWDKYRKATIITPNLKEISELIRIDIKNNNLNIEKNLTGICNHLEVKYFIVTRGKKGISLSHNGGVIHIPSRIVDVYDVTGAGDTVVATIAAFINRKNIINVIQLANKAAGIVVSKRGTSTITLDEINNDPISSKIMNIETLINQVKLWKKNEESIVFTNGCFDLIHKGHSYLINKSSEFGDHLIVAINSDNSVQKLKGDDRPFNNEYDRAFVIASIKNVDAVIIFNEDTPKELLKIIRPTTLVKGGDYILIEVVGREYADNVEIVNYLYGNSTSEMIKRIEKNGKDN